ncbi:MAG: hypothetical protein HC835_06880 [Oscillatoriales cyanobacterium RM2_1_1]|nr:hypothetical protein [Oscillatoriales cyanobacterium SM2_3_0]NJO45369.1 hypothetical protein [Oscillatoriales cyanobacterium RM2_1_1]
MDNQMDDQMDNPSILNHVSIGTRDLNRAKSFYDAVLAPLGCRRIEEFDFGVGWGKVFPEFWVCQPHGGMDAGALGL